MIIRRIQFAVILLLIFVAVAFFYNSNEELKSQKANNLEILKEQYMKDSIELQEFKKQYDKAQEISKEIKREILLNK